MTYLKKIIFAASLAVASLGFSTASNAALITHDILFDDGAGPTVVGEVTVHLFENGATGLQDIADFESFTFFGFDVSDVFGFEAIIDRDDVFAGLEFLAFDVDVIDIDAAVLAIYDAFALDPAFDNFMDVFEISTGDLVTFGEISLSEARVVSEPSIAALFALALIGFGLRRRTK